MSQHRSPTDWFGPFGIDAELAEKVLAAAAENGADDADLYFEHATTTSIGLSDRAVNRAHLSIDLGMGVRVVVGDQVGYAYTEDFDLESLLRAARVAAQIAHRGQKVVPVRATSRKISDFYPTQRHWADVDLVDRLPLVRNWEEWTFAEDPRVQKVQVSLADTDKHVLIVRLDGTMVADYRPMTRAMVGCTMIDGTQRETGHQNLASRVGLEYYTEERQRRMVKEAVQRASQALISESPPAGEMPVVLAAGSSGILLHEAIGHGMEADFNRKGISIYADKLGKRIAPADGTVVDDATVIGARGALNVDDEASPTEKTTLVENGILKTYLHDRISARHYGVDSTGSGRRESFRHPVLPRMRATYMEPGPHPPEDILKSVKNGLYCETFANGQVQIGAGDFAFYVRQGWLIEDGRLTKPVKDVNLIGNGPQVLESIEMVGNDLVIDEGGWTCGKDGQSVPVSQGMPTVKVAKLSVGGRR